jgi:hypothetical protein
LFIGSSFEKPIAFAHASDTNTPFPPIGAMSEAIGSLGWAIDVAGHSRSRVRIVPGLRLEGFVAVGDFRPSNAVRNLVKVAHPECGDATLITDGARH